MNKYVKELTDERYSERWIRQIRREIRKAFLYWGDPNPLQVKKEMLRDYIYNGIYQSPRNRKYVRTALSGYLHYCGNLTLSMMRWKEPEDLRINVHWLEHFQIHRLIREPKTPLEDMIIHLGLCMGMRRCEIRRLRLQDITPPSLTATGKWSKPRTIPFSPDTYQILDNWMMERERITSKYEVIDKDSLLLVVLARKYAVSLKETTADTILKRVSYRVGFNFAYHDLRRTWGHMAWEAGVEIEKIATIYGHKDIRTTLKYIGVNYDNMTSAMKRIYQFREEKFSEDRKIPQSSSQLEKNVESARNAKILS